MTWIATVANAIQSECIRAVECGIGVLGDPHTKECVTRGRLIGEVPEWREGGLGKRPDQDELGLVGHGRLYVYRRPDRNDDTGEHSPSSRAVGRQYGARSCAVAGPFSTVRSREV